MNPSIERKLKTADFGEVVMVLDKYLEGGALAIQLVSAEDGEPIARLSTRLDSSSRLPSDCFFMKDWSENVQISADVIQSGWVKPRPDIAPGRSGFICADAFELLDVPLTQAEIDEYYA